MFTTTTSNLSHNAEPLSDIVRCSPVAKLVLGLFLLTIGTRVSLWETWCQLATTGPAVRVMPGIARIRARREHARAQLSSDRSLDPHGRCPAEGVPVVLNAVRFWRPEPFSPWFPAVMKG